MFGAFLFLRFLFVFSWCFVWFSDWSWQHTGLCIGPTPVYFCGHLQHRPRHALINQLIPIATCSCTCWTTWRKPWRRWTEKRLCDLQKSMEQFLPLSYLSGLFSQNFIKRFPSAMRSCLLRQSRDWLRASGLFLFKSMQLTGLFEGAGLKHKIVHFGLEQLWEGQDKDWAERSFFAYLKPRA